MRTKLLNGKRVELTVEEETALNNEEAQDALEKPMRDWQAEIAETDKDLPRHFEDLLDALIAKGVIDLVDLPTEAQANYNGKKEIRGRKP